MHARKSVVAAISAAVELYMEAERQMTAVVEQPEAVREVREAPRPAYSPWAVAGRQSMMDMRRFLQMRLVR